MTTAEGMPNHTGGLGLTRLRVFLAILFCLAGAMHFVVPAAYASIVPPWLPNAPLLVLISGVCEIAGGLGVLHSGTRRLAGWGLIALLIAVYPANVHMLRVAYENDTSTLWKAALWIRLPLQLPVLWWVWRSAARPQR